MVIVFQIHNIQQGAVLFVSGKLEDITKIGSVGQFRPIQYVA